jgi:hypothetical protein
MKFTRFNKPKVLQRVGRPLLERFLATFAGNLEVAGITLPAATLADDEYCRALARVFMSPEGVPDELSEALYAVEELDNPEGHDRLVAAVHESKLDLVLEADSTSLEVGLQVWLACPALGGSHRDHAPGVVGVVGSAGGESSWAGS